VKKEEITKVGDLKSLLKVVLALINVISIRRRYQLSLLLVLQIIGAVSELISIAAIVPFIESLTNPTRVFNMPQLAWLIDFMKITTDKELIIVTTIIFGLSLIYVNIIRILVLRFELMLSASIGADISTNVYSGSLFKSYSYYTKNSTGKLVSIITNDLGALLLVVNNTLKIITNLFIVIAILIGLLIYDPEVVFAVFLIISVFFIIILNLNKRKLVRYGETSTDNHHKIIKLVQESLGGIRDILMGGYQNEFIKIYNPLDRHMRIVRAKSTIIRTIPRYILEIIAAVVLVIAVLLFSSLANNDQGVLSLLALLAMAGSRLLPTMNMVYSSYAGIQNNHPAIIKALNSINIPDELYYQNDANNLSVVYGDISLKSIFFSYENNTNLKNDWTLQNINVDIPVNSIIALVGETGSGKTTISDIILGLLHPSKGKLTVGGTLIDNDNILSWRTSVSHVPQSIYLSDASIKENIAFGVPIESIDFEKVKEVSKIACIDDFIKQRKKGFDEVIGENGVRLSGGQRQRIGIARALYRNPKLIVLDEATSSLDSTTELKVIQAIKKLSNEITIILLSHRLSTIKDVDKIYEVSDGSIINYGTFDEMITSSENFKRMVSENKI
jgi:ATP-binding cassette, subfamily B, bacterial PglK